MSLFGGKRGTMKALHRRKAECERMKIILSRRNKTGLFVRSMAIFFWANTIAVSTYTIASGPLRLSRLRISVARVQHSHQDGQRDKPITASVYRSRPVPQITHQTFLYSSSAYLASSDLDKRSTTKDKTLNDEDEAASQLLLVPSYRKLLVFASTTFMIWLSEPLLSLVDTTVVGLTVPNAVTQIASLGPATTFADSLLYSTYFLSIATTNLIAAALAVKDYRKLQQITSHVLAVAAILGAACTLFSFFLAPTLIAQMAGISGTPELVDFAVRYTWIRSSVAMASVIGITMQSFCLATQDIKTPALAVVAASITNVCGDLLLRKMGVIGAAMATAAASVVSAAILFWAVRNQLLQWRELEHQQQRLRLQTDTASDHLFRNASFATITNDDGIYHTVVHDVIEISDKASKPGCKSRPDSFRVITQTIKSEEDGIINKPLVIFALPDRKSALQLVTLAGP